MTPDLHTLLSILTLACLLQTIALVMQKVINRTYKGIVWWMWGYLAITGGFMLLMLPESSSFWITSEFIANFLFVTGLALLHIGTLRFINKKENLGFVLSILGLFILVSLYFAYISYNYPILMATTYIPLAIFALLTAWQLFKHKPRHISFSANNVCSIFILITIFYAFRSVTLFVSDPITRLFEPSTAQILTFLAPFITSIPLTFGLIIMINQRLNAEMQQAKTYFETIFNASPDPAVITRLDNGTFIDINQAHCEFSGHTRQELIGKSSLTSNIWKYPEERAKLAQLLEQQSRIDNFEATFIHKDGGLLYGLISARIIEINGVPHILSIIRDISERKRTEEALRESEESFRLLFENMNEAAAVHEMVYDEKGEPIDYRILKVNRAYEKMFSLSSDQAIGALASKLYGRGRAPHLTEHAEVARTGLSRYFETFIIPLHKHLIVSVFSPKKNQFATVFQDVTENKLAVAALAASEEKYRLLVENVHDIIYTINPQGVFTFVSPSWTMLLGHPLEQVKGHNFETFIHPQDLPKCLDFLSSIIESGQAPSEVVYRVLHADGSWRWHVSHVILLRDSQGKVSGLQGWAHDITEQKKLQAEITDLYEKEKFHTQALEEEAKLRLRFIDVLGHELKAPMTPIIASSGMLQEVLSHEGDSTKQKLAENIHRSTNLMLKRLEELLDVARFSRGDIKLNFETTDSSKFLQDVISRYQPSLDQRNQKLEIKLAADLPLMYLDQSRIEQVVVNLLSNASKYSSQNNSITLRAAKDQDGLLVEVADQGIGISVEDQAKLFRPYQRLGKEVTRQKGLGLGLTIVKQIVETHGGRIWATSEFGKGSTFSFWIPLKNPPTS
jgi:PAS domain S-box-containing protein